MKLALLKIFLVDGCYLQLASCGRLDLACDLYYLVVVEIKTRNDVI